MKRQIQESYDQIHAPKALIADTKRLVHTETSYEKKPTPNKKIYYITASIAACLCILWIARTTLLANKPQTTTPFNENPVNVGPAMTTSPMQFGSIKSEEEWKQYLQEIKKAGTETVSLESDYILYQTPIKYQGKSYTLQIQIKQGKLSMQQEEYILEGTYQCVILENSTILGTTKLDRMRSAQFTKEQIVVSQKENEQEDSSEFSIEEYLETGNTINHWYHVQPDYTVK